jgi:hypothetical protein
MTVTGKISVRVEGVETRDIDGIGGDAVYRHLVDKAIAFANGVASGEVDFVYSVDSVAVDDTGDAYDIVGSALQSVLDGTTDIDADEVIAIFVENLGGGSGDDLLVGGGSNPIPGVAQCTIPSGGFVLFYFGAAGVAVTGGSADTLNLDAASGEDTTAAVLILAK